MKRHSANTTLRSGERSRKPQAVGGESRRSRVSTLLRGASQGGVILARSLRQFGELSWKSFRISSERSPRKALPAPRIELRTPTCCVVATVEPQHIGSTTRDGVGPGGTKHRALAQA